jgi:condensin complex subunit 1
MSSPSDTTQITDRIASHRNALKIYSFFLLTIILTEESSAESCTGAKVISVRKLQVIQITYIHVFK